MSSRYSSSSSRGSADLSESGKESEGEWKSNNSGQTSRRQSSSNSSNKSSNTSQSKSIQGKEMNMTSSNIHENAELMQNDKSIKINSQIKNEDIKIMIKLFNKLNFFITTKFVLKNLIFRYLFLLKWRELTWKFSKTGIYYVAHNNTKYYLIASYLLGNPINNKTSRKIQLCLMKCFKVQNR